ncbi:hypothetical protein PNQ92_11940 [Halobacterium salinarum]|uniref:DUF6908 domain-containing protein n=1 Tax=Halobacterium salinarum TaxID=2242 RepID=UPI0025546902|nr:hypothetical protein [Halobacterium salinarum]MDL0126115.1 hypothetical protein [Halobacterium salinarum]
MDAVTAILEQLGVNSIAEMEVNESYTIEVDGYDDLTIEKVGEDRVSVGHYHISRGDLMSDPEVVFVVDTGEWKAVRYTQHPLVHKYDESGLELSNFVTVIRL